MAKKSFIESFEIVIVASLIRKFYSELSDWSLERKPGASVTNLFPDVIISLPPSARVFVAVSHFHPSLIYAGKAGAFSNVADYGTPL